MLSDPFLNESSSFVVFELTVVFLVYLCWMLKDARELGMKNYWIYIVLIVFPTVTVSFPVFLFMRERKLQELEPSGNSGHNLPNQKFKPTQKTGGLFRR